MAKVMLLHCGPVENLQSHPSDESQPGRSEAITVLNTAWRDTISGWASPFGCRDFAFIPISGKLTRNVRSKLYMWKEFGKIGELVPIFRSTISQRRSRTLGGLPVSGWNCTTRCRGWTATCHEDSLYGTSY